MIKLTHYLIGTYKKCAPSLFKYSTTLNPRRILTKDSVAGKNNYYVIFLIILVGNDGFDNSNADYILSVNDIIGSSKKHQ